MTVTEDTLLPVEKISPYLLYTVYIHWTPMKRLIASMSKRLASQSGCDNGAFGKNSIRRTYSVMLLESLRCFFSFQLIPSLLYKCVFSQSSVLSMARTVFLLRQTTGHKEQPSVQQQNMHPQNNHRTFTGILFRSMLLIRTMVSLNSSGATFPTNCDGNDASNRLLRPNTVMWPHPLIITGSGPAGGATTLESRTSITSSSATRSITSNCDISICYRMPPPTTERKRFPNWQLALLESLNATTKNVNEVGSRGS